MGSCGPDQTELMHGSLRLGRVRGIDVGINWSVLVIAWLLAWALADGEFPALAPGYGDVTYWLVAVVAVVFFFGSLLAHEVAHSLVAQRAGVRVVRITLWLFGGVSQFETEAQTPETELRIAVAGPATSLLAALVFGLVAVGIDRVGGSALGVAAAGWLSVVSVVLAVFNLAPAAPLDGGRVLHALVWRSSGDIAHATKVATDWGRRFAYLLIALGVLVLAAGYLDGLWFAFLGWFLLTAARAESTQPLLHGALAHLAARDVMTSNPIVAPDNVTVATLIKDWFLVRHCSVFPLADQSGTISGLLSLRQVRRVPTHERDHVLGRAVAVPRAQIVTAAPDDPLPSVLEHMGHASGSEGRTLVFNGDQLVGIISPSDIQRALDLAALRNLPARTDRS